MPDQPAQALDLAERALREASLDIEDDVAD